MAVAHGKSGYFQLDNAAGSLQNLSTYTRSVTFSPDISVHDTSTFGVSSRQKVTGLKDSSMTVVFVNDPTLQTHLIGIFGLATTSSFEYGPQGSTSGFRKITGEAWLTGMPIEASVDDVESITATFAITGDVTYGAF